MRPPGHGQHKASALKKKHTHKEAAVGPVMEVEAVHADGLPLKLQLQVRPTQGLHLPLQCEVQGLLVLQERGHLFAIIHVNA